jgi:hypothetical protein
MRQFKLIRFEYLSEKSNNNSHNSGQTPHKARVKKHFVDLKTGEYVSSTDLGSRINKRNNLLDLFSSTYTTLYSENKVSLFGIIVDEEQYNSISKFLNSMKRKLSRKNIEILGYVWVRDCGEIKGKPHFHLLLSTSYISSTLFYELFSKKRNTKFQVEFLITKNGLQKYLKRKGLYGSKRQRSFGKSKLFKKPN